MKQETQKSDIVQKLNSSVASVISSNGLIGFEKAYIIATAAGELKNLLTKEYMDPIMALQGNRLGFKTDRDDKGGYQVDVVKNCLIEAVLMGVQPFGNQFNIIQGNSYITKEGYGYLLANYKGLWYQIVPSLPRINNDKSGAAIIMKIKWSIDGGPVKEQDLDIPVKMNSFMGTDAVIGKATRKARAWLYNTITGSETPDGDIEDYDAQVVSSKINGNGSSIAHEDLQLLFDMNKEKLSETDRTNAERILNNKESASYSKLHKILSTL